ncbi:MAG: hypothetical protein AAF791_00995 [Bacteroidota bacterium]
MHRSLAPLLLALLTLSACSTTRVQAPIDTTPVVMDDVMTFSGGMMGGSGPFTLLSLRDGSIVVAADATGEARADSASAMWDIGIRGTEVIVNGGASGPGGVRGLLAESTYGDLTAVPDGLATDGEGECPSGRDPRVVCHGSGNGWYSYADAGVMPIETRTLVIARRDGSAAKVRFLSYELGDALPSGVRPRYVSLEATPMAAR